MTNPDFTAYSPSQLMQSYAEVLAELIRREIVRTRNAPLGDFVEYIALQVYGGALEPNSVKSHDLVDDEARKLQVKARSLRKPNENTQFSAFRSWDFDYAVFVVVDDRYRLSWAREIPQREVEARATFVPHDNKYMVTTSQMRSLGADVTQRFGTFFGGELTALAAVTPLLDAEDLQ